MKYDQHICGYGVIFEHLGIDEGRLKLLQVLSTIGDGNSQTLSILSKNNKRSSFVI